MLKAQDTKEETLIEETIRKVDMHAATGYDYYRLQTGSHYFIPCDMEEGEGEIKFVYHIGERTPMNQIKVSEKGLIYSLLIQVGEMEAISKEFTFSLASDNLYYDSQNHVQVQRRDMAKSGEQDTYFPKFKALAGTMLQKKYKYTDYLQGGMDLLEQQEVTKEIASWESMPEALRALKIEQEELRSYEKTSIRKIKKGKYRAIMILLGIFLAISIVSLSLLAYREYKITRPQQQALAAARAYLSSDYVTVIDSLYGIEVEGMDIHEKYILAVSYVKGQSVDNFSNEAKENILAKISLKGDEAILDYWIYLGRLDTEQAEDIALKLSDKQLLLYAYLQDRDQVSKNNNLSGNEKEERINALDSKIRDLANKLGIQYEEEEESEETATQETQQGAEEESEK